MVQAGRQGAGEAWQVVSRQPGWVTRAVLTLFLLLLALPFLLLLLIAIGAAGLLFAVLALANAAAASVGRLLGGERGGGLDRGDPPRGGGGPIPPDREGRDNVRVVRRD